MLIYVHGLFLSGSISPMRRTPYYAKILAKKTAVLFQVSPERHETRVLIGSGLIAVVDVLVFGDSL